LLFQAQAAKAVSIMKTLSGTFAFVALAVIAIVTLPSCSRKQVTEADEKKLSLKFGKKKPGTTTEYVEVDKTAFDNALCALLAHGGDADVEFLADAKASPTPGYSPSCTPPPVSINTDKITTSRVAQTEPAEESAAYDPNVVHRVSANSLKDIKDVLNSFEEPTPTPTP
jgi:hypothetical protein